MQDEKQRTGLILHQVKWWCMWDWCCSWNCTKFTVGKITRNTILAKYLNFMFTKWSYYHISCCTGLLLISFMTNKVFRNSFIYQLTNLIHIKEESLFRFIQPTVSVNTYFVPILHHFQRFLSLYHNNSSKCKQLAFHKLLYLLMEITSFS